jgi:hypothetical protein
MMSSRKNLMQMRRVLMATAAFGWLSFAPDPSIAGEQLPAPSLADNHRGWSPWIGSPNNRMVSDQPRDASPSRPNESGNPLWNVPLRSLQATRELPIFSLSRRPPVISNAPSDKPSPPVMAGRSAPPNVALVGAIAGEANGMAIFLNSTTKVVVRLKPGETYLGWRLVSVTGRQATMQRDNEQAVLALSAQPAR